MFVLMSCFDISTLKGFWTAWLTFYGTESHNVVAIRHAVIALGALSKSLESAPSPHLKVNVIQTMDRRHHEQAVFQHIKAIQALNQYITYSKSPQLRSALIACLLFVCFETFQGSCASSVQQIYGGLKILRNYYLRRPGSRPWIPGSASKPVNLKAKGRQKISNVSSDRGGCDNVLKEVGIVFHVDEYLDKEPLPQFSPEHRQMNLVESVRSDPDSRPEYAQVPGLQYVHLCAISSLHFNTQNHFLVHSQTCLPTNLMFSI